MSNFPTATNAQRGNYEPVEETYYIQGASLGASLPKSKKIRYDDNSLVTMLSPTATAETSKFVTLDAGGNINSAKNVISVIPDAPVLGYEPPESKRTIYPIGLSHGTGSIQLQTIDPTLIPNGNIYQIHFKDSRTNGIDDDGDWNININDIGEDNCPDAYELGNGDCNSSETGLIDANNDYWNDCGSDGICDENELG